MLKHAFCYLLIALVLCAAPVALALDAEQTEYILSVFEDRNQNPVSFDDYDKLATIAYARGAYEEAIGYIDVCIALAGEDADLIGALWTQKGVLYEKLEDVESALKALETAGEYTPQNVQMLLLRAELRMSRYAYRKAREDLELYLSLLPEDADAWELLAKAYEKLDSPEDAKKAIQTASTLRDRSGAALLTSARTSALQGDLETARNTYLQYVETEADEGGEAHFLLASVRMQLGELEDAVKNLKTALSLGYADPGVCYEYLSSCYFLLGNYEQALETGQLSIDSGSRAPAYDTLYQRMGISALSLGRMEDAVFYFTESIQRNDTLLGNYYYRGLASMSAEDYEAAVEDLTVSIERGELPQRCLYNRGLCRAQLGQMNDAIKDLEQAMNMTDEPEISKAAETILWQLAVQSITTQDSP